MKAIFSFYSKSYLALDSSFNSPEQQFKSAVLAVVLASVNVFGGFMVTRRMLEMFKKKEKKVAVQGGEK